MDFKCGIFDLDGTLIDSMPLRRSLCENVLTQRGIQPRPDFAEAIKPLTTREGCAYCKEQYGLSESTEELLEECFAILRKFYVEQVVPMPGLVDFLARMKAQGVKLYVATATERRLSEIALRTTGLVNYFDEMLTCAEAGAGKEQPDVYEQLLARSGCDKADAIIFEDALYAMRTAKKAGFRVAAIHDPALTDVHEEIRSLADYYVHSYEEL